MLLSSSREGERREGLREERCGDEEERMGLLLLLLLELRLLCCCCAATTTGMMIELDLFFASLFCFS